MKSRAIGDMISPPWDRITVTSRPVSGKETDRRIRELVDKVGANRVTVRFVDPDTLRKPAA